MCVCGGGGCNFIVLYFVANLRVCTSAGIIDDYSKNGE